MGIRDGAANGLRTRLENVGVRTEIAVAIGQVAYLPKRKRPSWIPDAVVPKSEVTWLVSQYEKKLADMPQGLAAIALVQGLCNRIFGLQGEDLFLTAYPEFAQDRWKETTTTGTHSEEISSKDVSQTVEFSKSLIESDLFWNGEAWVSAQSFGSGTEDETYEEAVQTSFASSQLTASFCVRYFDTPRNGLGEYAKTVVLENVQEDEGLSFVCRLVAPTGQTLEGFLVQSGERLGFFDGNDIMSAVSENLNQGSPVLFNMSSVNKVECSMDDSFVALNEWEYITPVPATGKFELTISTAGGQQMKLSVIPEEVLTNVYRSRYVCALYFLKILDKKLSSLTR